MKTRARTVRSREGGRSTCHVTPGFRDKKGGSWRTCNCIDGMGKQKPTLTRPLSRPSCLLPRRGYARFFPSVFLLWSFLIPLLLWTLCMLLCFYWGHLSYHCCCRPCACRLYIRYCDHRPDLPHGGTLGVGGDGVGESVSS